MADHENLSGLELLRAMIAGDAPRTPMAETMALRLVEARDGEVVFRGVPGPAHLNPRGQVHGGWYGTLLDSALGCAVQSVLPPGRTYTTLEYRVNLCRALAPGSEVEARARTQHAGRTTALATAEVRGLADGRLYATGSTTCLIMEARTGNAPG
jgi:uncharacterized protein (TIGR00369 family)